MLIHTAVSALREIRHYQEAGKLVIPKMPFMRVVRGVAADFGQDLALCHIRNLTISAIFGEGNQISLEQHQQCLILMGATLRMEHHLQKLRLPVTV